MRKSIFFCSSIFGLFLNAQEPALQQDQGDKTDYGAIITDRPDQTESPFLVPKNFFQIETGFLYSESNDEEVTEKETVYNSTLLRYGLLKNLELRLGLEVSELKSVSKTGAEMAVTGTSPLYAGFKIGVTEEKGILPQIGFLGGAFLPFVAAEEFRPDGTGGDFRFAFSHILSDKLDFSYNFGMSWNGENPYIAYIYSTVVGYAFTERLSGFVELYGDLPEEADAKLLADTGITYLLSDQIQLDLAGGIGLEADQDFFVGAGASIRFPG